MDVHCDRLALCDRSSRTALSAHGCAPSALHRSRTVTEGAA